MKELTNENLAYVMQPFVGLPLSLKLLAVFDARLEDNFGRKFRGVIDSNGNIFIINNDTNMVIAKPDL